MEVHLVAWDVPTEGASHDEVHEMAFQGAGAYGVQEGWEPSDADDSG